VCLFGTISCYIIFTVHNHLNGNVDKFVYNQAPAWIVLIMRVIFTLLCRVLRKLDLLVITLCKAELLFQCYNIVPASTIVKLPVNRVAKLAYPEHLSIVHTRFKLLLIIKNRLSRQNFII
jgi:hypothetical protein